MPDILLCTLNAKFIHASFGLRYLLANLGDLEPRAALIEFDINQRPLEIVEALLRHKPRILGFGVYIWNTAPTREVLGLLRRLAPEILIVLGGPEVSHETEIQAITGLADYVITGEADLAFADLCARLLAGERPSTRILHAPLPDPARLQLPYRLYTEQDVRNRIVYVEASRGCPFTCEFCLSSLDVPVRQVPLDPFLSAMQELFDRGVRHFKFVDRTFNLNLRTSETILRFFLDHYEPGLFVHFEMIPDRLPEELRQLIAQFPRGALQFEVGIQSFNPEVCRLISRKQDDRRLEDNFHFLTQSTGVHIHADLIVGLPGEDLASFGAGFDRLFKLGPQEIQVGILKRLRGTPIIRHDQAWGMVYSPEPPYEILQTRLIDFETLQRLRRFARYWDLVGNSGGFKASTRQLGGFGPSPFATLLRFSDWAHGQVQRTHAIALNTLAELLFRFQVEELTLPREQAAETLREDFVGAGRTELPPFLRLALPAEMAPKLGRRTRAAQRQARHGGADQPAAKPLAS